MRNVKLKSAALVGERNYEPGAVVRLSDERAAAFVRDGIAEEHDEWAEVANPDHNPLEDALHPYPPGGAAVAPGDAIAPSVEDNPGLLALVKAGKAAVRPREVTAESVKAGPGPEVPPGTTAAEIHPATPAKPEAAKPEAAKPEAAKPEAAPPK